MGRSRTRLRGGRGGCVRARHHERRPYQVRSAVRTLPKPRPDLDARYRRRLRRCRPRQGARVRHAEVRTGPRRAHRHVRTDGGEKRHQGRRPRDGVSARRHEQARWSRPGHAEDHVQEGDESEGQERQPQRRLLAGARRRVQLRRPDGTPVDGAREAPRGRNAPAGHPCVRRHHLARSTDRDPARHADGGRVAFDDAVRRTLRGSASRSWGRTTPASPSSSAAATDASTPTRYPTTTGRRTSSSDAARRRGSSSSNRTE